MDTAQLWAGCRAGDADARCALIERYATLATSLARGVRPATALADRDDLESAALIGLIDAVDRFQPDRGVPFEAYASLRIRGAVVDELRRVDERGRSARHDESTAPVSLDALLERGATEPAAADDGVHDRFEAEDLRARVQSALACLPPRQREVLARYYGEALTLREAGKRMGISEARACQLHGRAIQNLRRTLAVRVIQPQRVAATAA